MVVRGVGGRRGGRPGGVRYVGGRVLGEERRSGRAVERCADAHIRGSVPVPVPVRESDWRKPVGQPVRIGHRAGPFGGELCFRARGGLRQSR
jgi:hypothetical protein